MQPREARLVLREARAWAQEGLLTTDALTTIEERYGPVAADRRNGASTDFASRALYGTGGVLLGAAAIALVTFMDLAEAATSGGFLALGLLGSVLGLATVHSFRNAELGDALLVAAVVPFAAVPVPLLGPLAGTPAAQGYAAVAVLAPLAVFALRRRTRLVPFAATVAFLFASAFAGFAGVNAEATGARIWAGLTVAFLAGALAAGRAWSAAWRPEVLAVTAVGVAAATIGVLMTSGGNLTQGAPELIVGAIQAILLLGGLAIHEKGLVAGAAAVLAVDAVVFAFDVGGLLMGTGVLVTAAAVTLWQAELIRRFVKG